MQSRPIDSTPCLRGHGTGIAPSTPHASHPRSAALWRMTATGYLLISCPINGCPTTSLSTLASHSTILRTDLNPLGFGKDNHSGWLLANKCLYTIPLNVQTSLSAYSNFLFIGTVTGVTNTGNTQGQYIPDLLGPQNLQAMYAYGDLSFPYINAVFSNISESMTRYTRQTGGNHSAPAEGSVSRNDTCLDVR